MDTIQHKTISTYNRLGKHYLKDISRAIPKQLELFIKILPQKARVLDVGCAGGRDSKIFVKHGFDVVGIDASKVFIEEAKKYAPKAKFFQKDLRTITLPPYSFDAIWANAVLLHLKKREIPGILKKFYYLLKKDGILHIRVKKGKGSQLVKEKLSQNLDRFFTFFGREEVERMLRRAGFEIIYSREAKDELDRKSVPWVVVWGRKP